ncbi:hypothetical protein NLJ89_g461 [Agrocybe chaxingu]|uniref:N-acetyltransferase domain-containing protein n=1 Tax=Agrocybe chaxingu TaxID=84603 RepID=A0A9W8N1Z5_9AGAR|nr:hypothetical protein NLJ89_g461 [Agrocybe chaxingu]
MFDLPKNSLHLRAFKAEADLPKLLDLEADPEVAKLSSIHFLVPQNQRWNEEYLEKRVSSIENNFEFFCVIETVPATASAEEPEFVGVVGLRTDGRDRGMRHTSLGIGLAKKFWGKGYGSEIVEFVVNYAFRQLNMHRITLEVYEGNYGGLAVYKKCGFIVEVTHRKKIWYNGGWGSTILMGILVEDWLAKNLNRAGPGQAAREWGLQAFFNLFASHPPAHLTMFALPDLELRLRPFRHSDLDNLYKQEIDVDVAPLMTKRFITPRSEKFKDELRDEVEKEAEMFCIIETIPPESDALPEFVGATALWKRGEPGMRHTSFSIVLEKKFWNKKVWEHITKFMVDYAFCHLNMHRISLEVFEGNDRAIAVYQKCGFMLEGNQRKAHWSDGRWKDIIQMGILVDDWLAAQKAGSEAVKEELRQ